jgi:predicted hydrocarbon binding protein
MAEGYLHVELRSERVTALLSGVDELLDDTMKEQLLELCGRTCAGHCGSMKLAQSIAKRATEIDVRLERANKEIPWCGKWVREDDSIYTVCEGCGCPLVREGLVTLSPAFCYCSGGYVKAVFEVILGGPVIVELAQSIGRGDPVCRYVVRVQ